MYFIYGDTCFFGDAHRHVFEIITTALGKIFGEAFVVDIELYDASFGDVFHAVGAGRIGYEDARAFCGDFCCTVYCAAGSSGKDDRSFCVDSATGIADLCLGA